MSVENFLAGECMSDIGHEYVDGERFAMTGASRTHGPLCKNLLSRMAVHLEGGPCCIIASDMKVRLAHDRRFYFPDLVVSGNDAADEEDDDVETRPTICTAVQTSCSTR